MPPDPLPPPRKPPPAAPRLFVEEGPPPCPAPGVQRSGNVTIVTFTGGRARDVENVIAAELEGLTDELGEAHLLLDFINVGYVTSVELGTLVGLDKKLRAAGGRLTLFNLSPRVLEVFTVTRLEALLGVCR